MTDGEPMSDLTDMIGRFLAEYPDDVALHWQRTTAQQRAAAGDALWTAAEDLAAASERHREAQP